VLPVIGRLVDRYNPKVILVLALLVSSASIALMGLIQTPFQAILLYGVIFALSNAGTSVAPIGVLISRWFPDRLGLANSIAISGMGVGQLVIILLLTAQLDVIGWRGAFILLAGLGLVLIVPLMFLGAPTTGYRPTDRSTSGGVNNSRGGVSTAVCTHIFWILIVIYVICGGQDFFVATHVVAFASDQGLTSSMAGNLFALMGLFGLFGVLATGFLTDRYGPVLPTLGCFAVRIVVFTLVMLMPTPTTIILFALCYGITFWITAPLTVVFVQHYFGRADLGVLSGIIIMTHQAAGGAGAYLGGAVYDAFGDYHHVFVWMVVLSVVAFWFTWQIRRKETIVAL
jgi:predicted MFS family arabinose efflux permease